MIQKWKIAILFSILALIVGTNGFAWDPNLDSDGSNWIDANDLLYFMQHWHTGPGQEATETPTEIPTSTPTHTPDSGQSRVLDIPDQVQVEMTEISPGSGFYMGEAEFGITLSNVDGLARAEILFPFPLSTSTDYQVLVSSASLPALLSGWTLTETQEMDGYTVVALGWILEAPAGTALSGTGQTETILNVSVGVSKSSPLPEDEVIPLSFYSSDLQQTGGSALSHTQNAGSLLINPSGGPVDTATPTETPDPQQPTLTPTPTEEGPTATPTPTQTPGGDSAALQLSCCKPQDYIGNQIEIIVDQLDSTGHIANPGVDKGDSARDISLSLSGPATFVSSGGTTLTTTLEDPDGLSVTIKGSAVGQVTINASADGLTPATALNVEILNGGKISGTIQVPNPEGGGMKLADFQDATISVFVPGTDEVVATAYPMTDGVYETEVIAAGTYNVSVDPGIASVYLGTSVPLTSVCLSGIVVQNGVTTENVNADLQERTGGARVYGALTTSSGAALLSGQVMMTRTTGVTCGNPMLMASFVGDGETVNYELTNVPAGDYQISVIGFTSEENKTYQLGQLITITVPATGEVEKNLELDPLTLIGVQMDAPINYTRVASPTFQWTLLDSAGVSPIRYTVTLRDRCGEEVWSKSNISGTSTSYSGPALQINTIYNWMVIGTSVDLKTVANPQITGDRINAFIAD